MVVSRVVVISLVRADAVVSNGVLFGSSTVAVGFFAVVAFVDSVERDDAVVDAVGVVIVAVVVVVVMDVLVDVVVVDGVAMVCVPLVAMS